MNHTAFCNACTPSNHARQLSVFLTSVLFVSRHWSRLAADGQPKIKTAATSPRIKIYRATAHMRPSSNKPSRSTKTLTSRANQERANASARPCLSQKQQWQNHASRSARLACSLKNRPQNICTNSRFFTAAQDLLNEHPRGPDPRGDHDNVVIGYFLERNHLRRSVFLDGPLLQQFAYIRPPPPPVPRMAPPTATSSTSCTLRRILILE